MRCRVLEFDLGTEVGTKKFENQNLRNLASN